MSAGAVRSAIASFLTNANITGLEKVYLDQPWIALGGDWNLSANTGWGAIGWTHINSQRETRETMPSAYPGRTAVGSKRVDYHIGLVLLYQYLIPATPNSEDAWVEPVDTLLDGVLARLRSDPTMGTGQGGTILQAGQEADDLTIQRDLPRRDHGKVWCWQVIEFTATEIVSA